MQLQISNLSFVFKTDINDHRNPVNGLHNNGDALWYEYRKKMHQLHSPMPSIPINLDRNPGFLWKWIIHKCISDHGGEMLIVPVHIWDFQLFTNDCCLLISGTFLTSVTQREKTRPAWGDGVQFYAIFMQNVSSMFLPVLVSNTNT